MPNTVPVVVSKSKYLSGLQCHKRFWTEACSPELLAAPDAATQAGFDQGHLVGRLATKLFPGGLEISPRSRRWNTVVEATRKALTQRRPLYEAGFVYAGGGCRVDILVPASGDGWDLIEVKSSTSVKDVYLDDVAMQAFVVKGAGIELRDCFVAHIDKAYVRRGDIDPQELFVLNNVTEQVAARQSEVAGRLEDLSKVAAASTRPEIAIGPHCTRPYACPLIEECWAFLPPGNVFDLIGGSQKGFDLIERQVFELADIPLSESMSAKQQWQLDSWRTGEPRIEVGAIEEFLKQLEYPVHYFDIETFSSAIPILDGTRPYQQIPFLFSVHRADSPGSEARHFSLLVPGTDDPRADFMRAVRSALGEEGSIVAYNAPFERRILEETVASAPGLEVWVRQLESRFVDLLAPFRRLDFYHPQQLGSTSLKAVLPVLTGMSYAELDISDGQSASREFMRVTHSDADPVERARIQRQIEDYCGLDTLGMVQIIERLAAFTRA